MVKRTRRNLSDPRIKKIIKAQTVNGKAAAKKPQHPRTENSPGGKLLRNGFLLAITVSVVFVAYKNWTVIEQFYNDAILANISSLQQKEAPENLSPTFSQMQSSAKESESSETNNPDDDVEEANKGSDLSSTEVQTTTKDEPEIPLLQPVARRIQVEVLNGCGVSGLAEKFTNYLREQDIDVVSRGNYANFNVKKSQVIDRVANSENANHIASILGINRGQVQLKKDASLQLDATIILGKDYKSLKPFTN